MKNKLLIALIFIAGVKFSEAQTTATNFSCNDCAGNSHDLFSELNSGKVVVISFVMPCTSCIGPSLSAYSEVQNYASSNPGRVVFYISSDTGTDGCTSLNSWATNNGMGGATVISNTALKMNQYSANGTGMPKIIVLGGSSHTVFFNQNNGLNVTDFNNAINQALVAPSVGIKENSVGNFQLSMYPNPVLNKKTVVSYTLKSEEEITIDIYNALGAKVKSVLSEQQSVGKHERQIDLVELSTGVYYISLRMSDKTEVLKFVISE